MRHFHHLTWTDRLNIEKWLKEGMAKGEIAGKLRVHRNTITNELKRGTYTHLNSDYTTEERYSPDIAEQAYRDNLKAKGPDLKIGNDIALADYLENLMLNEGCSPAAALKIAEQDETQSFSVTLSKGTVYSYVGKGIFLNLTNEHLPCKCKKKRRYHHIKAKNPPRGESIEYRPVEIENREEAGHWEMDSIIGKKKTKKCLLTMTERKTREEIAILVKDHTAQSVVAALDRLERMYGSRRFREIFKTITVDNGTEFSDCAGMEQSCLTKGKRTKMYYCHPYSSWERGSNENQNRMLRRFFPKGTDFSKVKPSEVARAVEWVNNYPRLSLGWSCSHKLFCEQLISA